MKEKRKICIIASAPGSIVSFWKTNIEKISQYFDVYIVANFNDPDVFNDINIKGCKSINIQRRPTIWSSLKAIRELVIYFNEQNFDGFVSMSSNASLVSSIAGKIAKIPFRARIFTGQIWAIRGGLFKLFFKTIDRITVTLNTHILVDGRSQQEFLVKNGVLKNMQSTVLANGSICGVDIEKFCPNQQIRIDERKKLGFTEEDVVFTFMGRINRDKGTYELLEAFNRLTKQYMNAKLLFIGNKEGVDESAFEKFDNIKYNSNLIFYGYTKTPFFALQAGDVFCLPSYREGFGMSVIEAAALSMPVIASDAYGLRDSFVDGETGKKCKVMDVDSLYEAMEYFYKNPEDRILYGKSGRTRVVNLFSKELVSKCWAEYLNNNIKNE